MNDGTAKIYLNDETVNTCLGGILDAQKLIKEVEEIEYNGETVSIVNQATIRTGISDCIGLKNYDSARPNTGTPLTQWWADFCDEFYRNFIRNNQWVYLAKGLLTTIEITFLALILGVVLGFLVAIIRVTYSKTGKAKPLSDICQLYVAIIRGTPVMVQLLIIYFVLLLPIGVEKFPAAVLCFGLNSGAYVSEIVRGGIMSVDNGQTEAGRSLGFGYAQTMVHIVIPQAFKAVLPALANEFITLLKESSVAFYIGVADLTQGGIKIRSITYSNFMPLVAVALIYLVVVLGLTKLVSLLEKRLQKGDR
ncbi:MAG: amino acid ABC transporter permease [Clostridia bacterium]|nr:amino acid ABC transporter permease [Clostridia bacterium]